MNDSHMDFINTARSDICEGFTADRGKRHDAASHSQLAIIHHQLCEIWQQWMKTGAGVHLMFAEVFEKLQQTCW